MDVKKFISKVKGYVGAGILCAKYPFLYPRNRFSGAHYNSDRVAANREKIQMIFNANQRAFYVKFVECTAENAERYKRLGESAVTYYHGDAINAVIECDGVYCSIYKDGRPQNGRPLGRIDIYDYISRNGWCDGKAGLKIDVTGSPKNPQWNTIEILYLPSHWTPKAPGAYIVPTQLDFRHTAPVKDKAKVWWLKFVNAVLETLHGLPEYTELDSLPAGWVKGFGKQMCDELKRELKSQGYLWKYRITDIKEKNGRLSLNDMGAPNDGAVQRIIEKYEEISARTCAVCGKPASEASTQGGIPYCDECAPEKKGKTETN